MDLKRQITYILFGKIVLFILFCLFAYGPFSVEEVFLLAQKAEEKKSNTSTTNDNKKSTSEKARKSFISDLLELPPLNPENASKEDLSKYVDIATRKERQILERLDLLRKREEQLKNLEKSIEKKIETLDEERKYFAQTIQQEKTLKGERLTQLISLYAKMEPKKAGPIFEKLDRDLVVELFKQLPQKQVTAILEAMSPDRSVALSEYYGRVRSAREYDLLKEMNESLRKEFDECRGMPSPDSSYNSR
jgi:flagellar motility protein MotE (MotC chaperone)